MSSSYTRTPRQVTVHCPVAGCKWLKTYFDDPRKQFALELRARLGVNGHVAKHCKATTLINGR